MNVYSRWGFWLIIPFLFSCTEAVTEGSFFGSLFSTPQLDGGITSVTVNNLTPNNISLPGACDDTSTAIEVSSDGVTYTAAEAGSVDTDCSDGMFNINMSYINGGLSPLSFTAPEDGTTKNYYIRTVTPSGTTDPLILAVTYDTGFGGPTLSLSGEPAGLTNILNTSVSVSSTQAIRYQYQLISSVAVCNSASAASGDFSMASNIVQLHSALGDGTWKLCVKGFDLANNEGPVFETASWPWDRTAPTGAAQITVAGEPGGTSDILDSPLNIDVTGSDVVEYRFKFGLQASINCSVAAGYSGNIPAATNITNAMSGDNLYRLCLYGRDAAGNWMDPAVENIQRDWAHDGSAPTVVLSNSDLDPVAGVFNVTVTFSEAVPALTAGDFSFTGPGAVGLGSAMSGGPTVYNLALTPTTDGVINIVLPANSRGDAAGNLNLVSNTLVKTYLAPVVGFQSVSSVYNESAGSDASFDVVIGLNNDNATGVTVDFAYGAATASTPNDYSGPGPSTVSGFTVGTSTQTLTFSMVDDDFNDNSDAETIVLNLTAPANATLGTSSHTITLNDNEGPPSVSFVTAADSTSENQASADIIAQLSHPSEFATSVNYRTTDGTAVSPADFAAIASTPLGFSILSTVATVTVGLGVDDAVSDGNKNFTVDLEAPLMGLSLGGTTVHTHTISDDENPQIFFQTASTNVTEGSGTFDVVIELTTPVANNVSFDFATSGTATIGGSNDYTYSPASATITAGQTLTTVTVALNSDGIGENAETIVLDINTITTLDSVGEGAPNQYNLIIDANETPTIGFAADTNVPEATASHDVVISLSNTAEYDVTFTVNDSATGTALVSDDFSYTSGWGSMQTILAGSLTHTVVTGIVPDALYEGDQTVDMDINGISGIVTASDANHTFTIQDDDPTPVFQFQSASSNGGESVASANLLVDMTPASDISHTVRYGVAAGSATNGTDYGFISAGSILTFNPGETVQTITVTGILDDSIYENPDETIDMLLSTPQAPAIVSGNTNHVYTINDNEPHGAPDNIQFTVQPNASYGAGDIFNLEVTMYDIDSNIISTDNSSTVTLSFANNAGGGALGGTLTATVVNGVAIFNATDEDVYIDLIGAGYTLRATEGARQVVSNAFNITHGTAAQLAFTTQPLNFVTAGVPLEPIVTVQDAFGNTVTSDNTTVVTLAIGTNPGAAVLNPDLDLTVVNGVADWNPAQNMFMDKASGGYDLAATSVPAYTGAISSSFTILAAPADRYFISTQPINSVIGTNSISLQVEAHDPYGNLDTSSGATPSVSISAGSGVLSGTAIQSFIGGVANFNALDIDLVGSKSLDVTGALTTATSNSFEMSLSSPYIWTGAGGNTDFTNASNWSTTVVPSSGNTAIFNDQCQSNCAVDLDANIAALGGLDIQGSFTGSFDTNGFDLDIENDLSVNAGTFNLELGSIVTVYADIFVAGGAVFNSTGTSAINMFGPIASSLDMNGHFLELLVISKTGVNTTITNPATVDYLQLDCIGNGDILSSNINVNYNLSLTGAGTCGGDTTVRMIGNGTTQTIFGGSGVHRIPNLDINKASGLVHFNSDIEVHNNLTRSNGNVSFNGPSVAFVGTGSSAMTGFGAYALNDLIINKSGGGSFGLGSDLNVTGDFYLQNGNLIGAYSLSVDGNVNINSGASQDVDLIMTGAGTNIVSSVDLPFNSIVFDPAAAGVINQASSLNFGTVSDVTLNQGQFKQDGFDFLGIDNLNIVNGVAEWYQVCATLGYVFLTDVAPVFGDEVFISIDDQVQTEGSGILFNVSLDQPNCTNTTFDYSTADNSATQPSDYTQAISLSMTITSPFTIGTLTIIGNGDALVEPTEDFTVNLSNLMPGVKITDITGQATITDDDSYPTINIANAGNVNEGANAEFVVSLSTTYAEDITFDWATVDGTALAGNPDYTAGNGDDITITSGSTLYTITVATVDDGNGDDGEIFTVQLSDIVNATAGVVVGQADLLEVVNVPIYRSAGNDSIAGPHACGTSDGFCSTNNGDLTISGSIATFASPLPDNVGVGDIIQYDRAGDGSIDSVMAIAQRISSTSFDVQDMGGLDVTDMLVADQDWGIHRAYFSIADAEAGIVSTEISVIVRGMVTGGDRDLVTNNEIWKIAVYGDNILGDQAAVTFSGWTTSSMNYFKVFVPSEANQVGISQRHSGQFDNTKAFIEPASGSYVFRVQMPNVHIEGLQVRKNGIFSNDTLVDYSSSTPAGDFYLEANFIQLYSGNPDNTLGFVNYNLPIGNTLYASNNIVTAHNSSYTPGGTRSCFQLSNQGDSYLYNNTVVNCGSIGIGNTGSGTHILKNNISQQSGASYSGSFDAASDHNLAGDSTAPGANPHNNVALNFLDEANYYYRIGFNNPQAVGVALSLNADANYPITHDILGQDRGTMAWDLGASIAGSSLDPSGKARFRSVGPGETGPLGFGGTLDVKNSIAIFSNAQSEIVGVGDVLEYDVNDSSVIDAGELAIIHERISDTQYYVRRPDGTPAQDTVSSTEAQWNICRAYVAMAHVPLGAENDACLDNNIENFDPDGNARDLVTDDSKLYVAMYRGAPGNYLDDSATAFSNAWITDAEHYIRIFAPRSKSEVGLSQRHNGQFTAYMAGFRNEATAAPSLIIDTEYSQIEGLQFLNIDNNTTITAIHASNDSFGSHLLNGNLFMSTANVTGKFETVVLDDVSDLGTRFELSNNIFLGTEGQGCVYQNQGEGYYYNNIFANCVETGSYQSITINNGGLATDARIHNNIFYDERTQLAIANNSGASSTGDRNIFWDPIAITGYSSGGNEGYVIPNFKNPDAFDFRIDADTDTEVRDLGQDFSSDPSYSVKTDIVGRLRRDSALWDKGPYEQIRNGAGDQRTDLVGLRFENETPSSFDLVGDVYGDSTKNAAIEMYYCPGVCDPSAPGRLNFDSETYNAGTVTGVLTGIGGGSFTQDYKIYVHHFDVDNENQDHHYFFEYTTYPVGVIRVKRAEVYSDSPYSVVAKLEYENDSESPANAHAYICDATSIPGCDPETNAIAHIPMTPNTNSNGESLARFAGLVASNDYNVRIKVSDSGLSNDYSYDQSVITHNVNVLTLKDLIISDLNVLNVKVRVPYVQGGNLSQGANARVHYCSRTDNGGNCNPTDSGLFFDIPDVGGSYFGGTTLSGSFSGDEVSVEVVATDPDGVANNNIYAGFTMDSGGGIRDSNMGEISVSDIHSNGFKIHWEIQGDENRDITLSGGTDDLWYCVGLGCDPMLGTQFLFDRDDNSIVAVVNGTFTNNDVVRIRANADDADGTMGSPRDFQFIFKDPVLDAPEVLNLVGTPISENMIDLSWHSDDPRVHGFRINYSPGSTAPTGCSVGNIIYEDQIAGNSFRVSGLDPGGEYSFRVCTLNAAEVAVASPGVTLNSVFALIDGNELVAPQNPSWFAAKFENLSTLRLEWDNSMAGVNGFAIAYNVGLVAPLDCTSGVAGNILSATVGNGNNFNVNGLTAYETYAFRLCSEDANRMSGGVTSIGKVEPNGPQLDVHATSAKEGGILKFVVSISEPQGSPVQVDYNTFFDGGADVSDVSGSLSDAVNIPAGETYVTLPDISVTADGSSEGTENIRVDISNPNGVYIRTNTARGYIRDVGTGEILWPKGPDGTVLAAYTDLSRDETYMGGDFTAWDDSLNNNLFKAGGDGVQDEGFFTGKGFNGEVKDILVQNDGNILFAGSFTNYQGTAVFRIVRLLPNGDLDPAFQVVNGFDGPVNALALQKDGKIIAVGDFNNHNGTGKAKVARLNDDGTLDATFASGSAADGEVYAIELLESGEMFIAGAFDTYDSLSNSRIAMLQADGTRSGSFVPPTVSGVNPILDIAVQSNGKVIAGGTFQMIDGQVRNRMARYDANGSLDLSFDPDSDGFVKSVELLDDGTMYVGGAFGLIGGQTRSNLARLDATGSVDGFNPILDGNVYDIVVDDNDDIFVVGVFQSPRQGIVKIDPAGSAVSGFNGASENGISLAPGLRYPNTIALTPDGRIYVGGRFKSYNGNKAKRLLRVDSTDNYDAGFDTSDGFDDVVNSVIMIGSTDIIVGGNHLNYTGASSPYLTKLSRTAVSDSFFEANKSGSGPDAPVLAMLDSDGAGFIIAGSFTSYSSSGPSNIAKINDNGSLQAGWGAAGANGTVYSVAEDSSFNIILGGTFTQMDSNLISSVAKLDSAGNVDTGFNFNTLGASSGIVLSVAVDSNNDVFAAGSFTQFNGADHERIVKLNFSDGTTTSFAAGPSSGFDNTVKSIDVQTTDNKILATGLFTTYNSTARNGFARINTDGGLDLVITLNLSGVGEVVRFNDTATDFISIGGQFSLPAGPVQQNFTTFLP